MVTLVKGDSRERAGDGQTARAGARWRKCSLKKRMFAPLVEADARLPCKEEIWTKRVVKKSSKTIMRKFSVLTFSLWC